LLDGPGVSGAAGIELAHSWSGQQARGGSMPLFNPEWSKH